MLARAVFLIFGAAWGLAGGNLHAQNDPIPLGVFPTPTTTGVIGTTMPAALSELAAYIQTVSATGWKDLQADGTITYPGDEYANPARLYLSSAGLTRLDISMNSGTRSLRIKNHVGMFTNEKGYREALVSETSSVGLLAFPRLWASAPLYARLSLLDRGVYNYRGHILRRITIEFPWNPDGHSVSDPTVATDLYFELSTHLLLYSVDAVSFTNSFGHALERVTTYDMYQSFEGVLIPTAVQQSVDGQTQWSLQISQVTINSNLDTSLFSF